MNRSRTSRLFFRQGIQIESLEPRWLLAATTADNEFDLGIDGSGQQFIQGQALAAIQTPTVWNNGSDVERFLTSQIWPQGLREIADDFELSYSFQNSSGTRLAVGKFNLQDSGTTLDTVDALNSLSFVEWAQPNYVSSIELDQDPNDPLFGQQWHHATISSSLAWNTTIGSPNVLIAVLDEGVHMAHPDLADGIWTNPGEIPGNNVDDDHNEFVDDVRGWDFLGTGPNGDNDPSPVPQINLHNLAQSDPNSHGTLVAGTAAATINNGIGVAGVAGGARILPLRVCRNGSCDAAAIIRCATVCRRHRRSRRHETDHQ